MKKVKQLFVVFLASALAAGVAILVAGAVSSGAGATPVCPSIGTGVGCAYVITVNPTGTVSIAAGADPASFDGGGRGEGDDVMVGVVNDSNAITSSITLSSTNDIFGFDGDEICTYTFTSPVSSSYCATNGPNNGPSYTTSHGKTTGINPYDAEGPDNTFTNIITTKGCACTGTINFDTPLIPQKTTFLSLETAPTKTTATAALTTGLTVSAPVITGAVEGNAASLTGSFTDTGSMSAASYFEATINWGDGTTSTTTSSTDPVVLGGGSGSFTVSGTHTYAEETPQGTPDEATVTITDPDLVSYSSAVATVTSADEPVTVADAPLYAGSAAAIGPQQTNVPFTTSATFTDGNPDAPLSDYVGTTISWGDGTTSTTNPSSPDPVVITAGPGPAGSFTVTGTHEYTANTVNDPDGAEPSPVTFYITDVGGMHTTVYGTNVVVADSVTPCSSSAQSCTGTVTATSTQPVGATVGTSTSETGDLLVSANPTVNSSGGPAFNCGDDYAHAPSVVSESITNTVSTPTGTITSTDSFPAADGVILDSPPGTPLTTPEPWGPDLGQSSAFWVCFQANQEFNDVSGGPAASSTDSAGNTVYTGLLPLCDPSPSVVDDGPCVNYVSVAPNTANVLTVSEEITYPASFATSNDPAHI